MSRLLPFALVVLLGIGAALLINAQFGTRPAAPAPVPDGDHEVAYIHTTTNTQTWERFVAGVVQVGRQVPGVEIDDTGAFPDRPAAVPEVVVSRKGRAGKLRFRWYKLSSEVGNREWVTALAERGVPPVAFMGGGTSDRAIELAVALNEREVWKGGPRPLLVITTATANQVDDPETGRKVSLTGLYPGRTFRGCFTNAAMAEAVVDFVWRAAEFVPPGRPPRAHVMAWQDDPYSVDLADEFVLHIRTRAGADVTVRTVLDKVAYSVGTFTDPNPPEREVMDRILPDVAAGADDKALLVLPAATQPARRILRAFAADSPLIGKHLTAVTGDGVSFNTVYRDGDVAWPIRELSIPLVFFAHQNPVAWAGPADDPTGSALRPPNSTDDVLLFADEVRVLAEAVFARDGMINADELAARLRAREPAFFTEAGERRPGAGEHVIVLQPQFLPGDRVAREAVIDVYARKEGAWERVQRLVK